MTNERTNLTQKLHDAPQYVYHTQHFTLMG